MAIAKKKQEALRGSLDYLQVHGNLINGEYIPNVVRLQGDCQQLGDYRVKGSLNETIAAHHAAATRAWEQFRKPSGKGGGNRATETFLVTLLHEGLGFLSLKQAEPITIEENVYPINYEALGGDVPVVIDGTGDMDTRQDAFGDSRRARAAFALTQSYLNASVRASWGLVCDREKLRVVRDNASMSRFPYIEADIASLFGDAGLDNFTSLWLLCHESRFGAVGEENARCPLERWREAALAQGQRAREHMRQQVEVALGQLGNGFLEHSDNQVLRDAMSAGKLSERDYFWQLLRLVYRMISLAALEARQVIPAPSGSDAARSAYLKDYSITASRDQARVASNKNRRLDAWEAHKIVRQGLFTGQPKLALPRLAGPFNEDWCPNLDRCVITNDRYLRAVEALSYTVADDVLTPVNWRDMGLEEMGSIYESLLELTPRVVQGGRAFEVAVEGAGRGSKRKSTGSYYTPESLVQSLLDSGLDPLLEAARSVGDVPAQLEATLALRVLDPACGSAHMLLAAARRIARQVVKLQTDGAMTPAAYRRALRKVLTTCIFGVDKNPMVLDVIEVGFLLETGSHDLPTAYFRHHLRCGDSLLGLMDVTELAGNVPQSAYAPLSGDDKKVCGDMKNRNKEGSVADDAAKTRLEDGIREALNELARRFEEVDVLPDDTPEQVHHKEAAWFEVAQAAERHRLALAAELYMGAYLCPKGTADANLVPTTPDVHRALRGDGARADLRERIAAINKFVTPLHWQLAFPQVFARGGFDLVLMNPPWDRITLNEQEFFGERWPAVARAKNKSERTKEIEKLRVARQGSAARTVYDEFVTTKHAALAFSNYAHCAERFDLSGKGDVNVYALFTETALRLRCESGRAALVVPSGIATDLGTSKLFGHLVVNKLATSLLDLENREALFPDVDSRYRFCLLSIGRTRSFRACFFLANPEEARERERILELTGEDLQTFNPNTRCCPTFRSRRDLDIARKVYRRVPVLWDESRDDGNPWDIKFSAMFHMSNDSDLFNAAEGKAKKRGMLPLYEAKMFHQFDYRWATYESGEEKAACREVTDEEKRDASFFPTPHYFVESAEVKARLQNREDYAYLCAFRGIARATDSRTMIASLLPVCAVGNSAPVIYARSPKLLVAILGSIVFDYCARQKVAGTNFNFFILKQIPAIPLSYFDKKQKSRIEKAVERLQWPLFADPNAPGNPLSIEERANLRAELDAFFAAAYGLDRSDLAFILDPQNEASSDSPHPSETFSVLKRDEERAYGEYRTERLVLGAWDRLEQRGELPEAYDP